MHTTRYIKVTKLHDLHGELYYNKSRETFKRKG